MKTSLFIQTLLVMFSLTLISSSSALSQTGSNSLDIVLNSDFIESFDVLRSQAEKMVSEVKGIEQYNIDDMEAVEASYDLTAQYFNEVLYNVKDILLNRDRRKYFFGNNGRYLEDFHKVVEADLLRAEKFFQEDFRKEYLRVVSNDATIDMFVREFLVMLQTTLPRIVDLFYQIQDQLNLKHKQLIDTELIEKHRFRNWKEL